MTDKTYRVLFICTGNSARSIMAEAILNQIGGRRFRGYSAGSHPVGYVHPAALQLLNSLNHDTGELRSKDWREFTTEDAPSFDFVFTVCDKAAGEPCPVWPGQPMRAHWGVEDPAMLYADDERVQKLFFDTYLLLKRRIELFCNLPLHKLDAITLKNRVDELGATQSSPDINSN
ncbi:arsenate reductase ArsC [Methylomonas sp. SURF-2]|uniref:Arsenate reductase ArsC n=1 Tax=Methylomonas subterranea TaxID=2952225 RepID=A0ABT1TI44_9GAMM|nr:arsenate reductase ArsC [Methylomonas sp. SURF-2]MCQ8104896.1 arsenate reductase ArsC [Methylomonas sp. SURF-2]